MELWIIKLNPIFFSAVLLAMCGSSIAQITCEQFDIGATLNSNVLSVAIRSDLPDDTIVIVSVDRLYKEVGSDSNYSCDYFLEKATLKEWRLKRKVEINHAVWTKSLRAKQDKMSSLGIGFDVASISDNIRIEAVVPIIQKNTAFGNRNEKLVGGRVDMSRKSRSISDSKLIRNPIDSSASTAANKYSLDPRNLTVGYTYIPSKKTPLMPYLNPTDPMDALGKVKQIQRGGSFSVIQKRKKDGSPWYYVEAHNPDGTLIGKGWVNSIALLGQQLRGKE